MIYICKNLILRIHPGTKPRKQMEYLIASTSESQLSRRVKRCNFIKNLSTVIMTQWLSGLFLRVLQQDFLALKKHQTENGFQWSLCPCPFCRRRTTISNVCHHGKKLKSKLVHVCAHIKKHASPMWYFQPTKNKSEHKC